MGNIFSGSEIVELGIQIEKNGRDFYSALTRRSKDTKAKETFEFLAGEETKHIGVFEEILKNTENYSPAESYPGEYMAYMSALAQEYVFTRKAQGAEIAGKITSDLQALELGMGFERDSIVFYEGMKKTVPEHEIKIVDELISQEQRHQVMLSELKQTFK